MDNIIIIFVLVIMIGSSSFYIWKERKKGVKCIGCPSAKNGSCSKCQSCSTGKIADNVLEGGKRN